MAWRHRWCLASPPPLCVPLLTPLMPPFACISPSRDVRHATDLARVLYHRRAGDELHLLGALCTCQPRHLCDGGPVLDVSPQQDSLGTPPGGQCAGHSEHHGITSGSLIVDDTDNPRSKAAKALAYLYKLRDKASGGYLWGQSLVFLVLVTPKISLPVGVVFYQPAPELSAWYKTAKALKKRGGPPTQRPRKPAPNPQYPTKEQLALRLLASFKAQHGAVRIHAVMADALYGTATFVDGASALF